MIGANDFAALPFLDLVKVKAFVGPTALKSFGSFKCELESLQIPKLGPSLVIFLIASHQFQRRPMM